MNSARVAAFAAVDGGIWKQASFEGGGLQDVKAEHYKRHVPPISGAGIVYTPPQYSDHVAVAVVLEGLMSTKVKLAEDTKTRRCQPWSRQRDVRSFFCGTTTSRVVENKSNVGGARGGSFVKSCSGCTTTTKKKRKQVGGGGGGVSKKEKKKKKGGISSFFRKK